MAEFKKWYSKKNGSEYVLFSYLEPVQGDKEEVFVKKTSADPFHEERDCYGEIKTFYEISRAIEVIRCPARFLNICQTILSFGEHVPYEKTEYHHRKPDIYIWLCFLVYQILTSSLIKNRRSGISLTKIKIWDNKSGTKCTLLC